VSYYHAFKGILLTVCVTALLAGYATVSSIAADKDVTCAPEVTDWSPKIEEIKTRRPTITATFKSKCGVDIDVSTIQMVVDDETVYPEISGSGSGVTLAFVPYLGLLEECNVTVSAQDVNGQKAEKTWMFEVPYWVQEFW